MPEVLKVWSLRKNYANLDFTEMQYVYRSCSLAKNFPSALSVSRWHPGDCNPLGFPLSLLRGILWLESFPLAWLASIV